MGINQTKEGLSKRTVHLPEEVLWEGGYKGPLHTGSDLGCFSSDCPWNPALRCHYSQLNKRWFIVDGYIYIYISITIYIVILVSCHVAGVKYFNQNYLKEKEFISPRILGYSPSW